MSKELHLTQEQDFEKFRHAYRAAIKEVRIKIEILSEDFAVRHDYNPIHHMERRLKATESIEETAQAGQGSEHQVGQGKYP
ncbi:MAG: hypothetical protein ACLTK0_04515 [Anaerovoracaceae bacterium]